VTTYEHLGRLYHLKEVPTPSWEYIIERTDFLRKQAQTVPVKVGGGYV